MKKRHIVTGAFALLATLQSPEIAELDKGLIGRQGSQTNPTASTPADNKKLSKSAKKEAKKTEHKANDPELAAAVQRATGFQNSAQSLPAGTADTKVSSPVIKEVLDAHKLKVQPNGFLAVPTFYGGRRAPNPLEGLYALDAYKATGGYGAGLSLYTMRIESGMNPAIIAQKVGRDKNGRPIPVKASTGLGGTQALKDTWLKRVINPHGDDIAKTIGQRNPQLGEFIKASVQSKREDAQLALRTELTNGASILGTAFLQRGDAEALRDRGVPVSACNLYMMHFHGNPSAYFAARRGEGLGGDHDAAAHANPKMYHKTVTVEDEDGEKVTKTVRRSAKEIYNNLCALVNDAQVIQEERSVYGVSFSTHDPKTDPRSLSMAQLAKSLTKFQTPEGQVVTLPTVIISQTLSPKERDVYHSRYAGYVTRFMEKGALDLRSDEQSWVLTSLKRQGFLAGTSMATGFADPEVQNALRSYSNQTGMRLEVGQNEQIQASPNLMASLALHNDRLDFYIKNQVQQKVQQDSGAIALDLKNNPDPAQVIALKKNLDSHGLLPRDYAPKRKNGEYTASVDTNFVKAVDMAQVRLGLAPTGGKLDSISLTLIKDPSIGVDPSPAPAEPSVAQEAEFYIKEKLTNFFNAVTAVTWDSLKHVLLPKHPQPVAQPSAEPAVEPSGQVKRLQPATPRP